MKRHHLVALLSFTCAAGFLASCASLPDIQEEERILQAEDESNDEELTDEDPQTIADGGDDSSTPQQAQIPNDLLPPEVMRDPDGNFMLPPDEETKIPERSCMVTRCSSGRVVKCEICHKNHGSSGSRTIRVSLRAAFAHLRLHDDTPGACSPQ